MSIGKIIGAFGIIGAILMVVCVFLEWGSIELIFGSSTSKYAFSGWDLYSDATVYKGILIDEIKISDLDISNYSYAPLVVLICGVVGIIATILPMFVKNETASRVLGIIALILAIVSIVLMVLYVTDLTANESVTILFTKISYAASASYGAYIGIVGALLMVIGGIADITKKNC